MIQRPFFLYALCLLCVLTACSGAGTPVEPALPATPQGAVASATPDTVVAANPNSNSDVVVSASTPTKVPSTATPLPPTATATPVPPTATPTPALRQLTTGRCCVNPFWRADGETVRFIDRPTTEMPVGYYEVPLATTDPLLMGTLVTETLGNWSHRDRFYLIPGANGYTVIDNETGQTYQTESTGNNRPNISPDGTRLAYQVSDQNQDIPPNERFASLYIADLDGSNEQLVMEGRGTSFSGWLGNDNWFLSVISPTDPEERILRRYSLSDGTSVDLAIGARIQGTSASPDGQYIAYYVTLDRQHPERNGYWLTNTQTGETRTLPFVGSYRWRTPTTLLVIPFEPGATSFRLQEYDLTTDTLRDLTDPATVSFRIHNNDWALSPDGNRIVFVNAVDRNLWVIELPQ